MSLSSFCILHSVRCFFVSILRSPRDLRPLLCFECFAYVHVGARLLCLVFSFSSSVKFSSSHPPPAPCVLMHIHAPTHPDPHPPTSLIEATLARVAEELQASVEQVKALAPGRERRGRHDDVTVVVVFFEEERLVGCCWV